MKLMGAEAVQCRESRFLAESTAVEPSGTVSAAHAAYVNSLLACPPPPVINTSVAATEAYLAAITREQSATSSNSAYNPPQSSGSAHHPQQSRSSSAYYTPQLSATTVDGIVRDTPNVRLDMANAVIHGNVYFMSTSAAPTTDV